MRGKLWCLVAIVVVILVAIAALVLPPPVAEVEVIPTSPKSGLPGDFVTHVFRLIHRAPGSAVYTLTVEPPRGWRVVSELRPVSLPEAGQEEVFVTLAVPPAALAGRYELKLFAIAETDPRISNSGSAGILVGQAAIPKVRASVPKRSALPGEEVTFPFTITNIGNIFGAFRIAVKTPPGFYPRASVDQVSSAPAEIKTVSVKMRVPEDASPGLTELVLKANSEDHHDRARSCIEIIPP